MAEDFYDTLGISREASDSEIKSAYRKLARKYHPDVNPGNSSAENRFKEISEAYEVLSDPDKRRRYEQFGQYWNRRDVSSGGGFDVDFGSYGNFDEFINDLGREAIVKRYGFVMIIAKKASNYARGSSVIGSR